MPDPSIFEPDPLDEQALLTQLGGAPVSPVESLDQNLKRARLKALMADALKRAEQQAKDAPAPPTAVTPKTLLGMTPAVSHPPEAEFQSWMKQKQIDPRELDVYDFRAAKMAGADRDASGHWPSDFKRGNHPNLVVGGFNTKTGERVAGAPLAKSEQELIDQGWEPAAAKRLWASVTLAPQEQQQ